MQLEYLARATGMEALAGPTILRHARVASDHYPLKALMSLDGGH
jgi:hypothetical protein